MAKRKADVVGVPSRRLGRLPIRSGYEPPGTAHVVRGGEFKISDLRNAAEVCREKGKILGLTVYIAEVPKVEDLIVQAGTYVTRYPSIGMCSLAVLSAAKYEAIPTKEAPHYTVVIPNTTKKELERFRDCFLVMPNPCFDQGR